MSLPPNQPAAPSPALRRSRIRLAVPSLVSSAGAVAVALLVGALVIAFSGDNPVTAYHALFDGALNGKKPIAETLVAATPLIFGGLAFAVAFRAGMFNIGIEGQLLLGGLASGLVGALDLGLPAVIFLPLALLAGAAAGGLWGALPGFLKARTGAHEVISTIMLNYLALRISSYAVTADNWLKVNPSLQETDPTTKAAQLPRLLSGTRLHAGILLALAAAAILGYVLFRTTLGYRIRVVGLSRGAAAYGGISWGRTITVAMLLSGLLAGLGGACQTLGLYHRYYNQSAGVGFTAIAVGLVGRNNPAGVVLAGLLFGVLSSGATRMQNTAGTSKEIVQVLQGLVILAVAALAFAGRLRFGRRAPSHLPNQPGRQPAAPTRAADRSASVGMEPELEPRAGPPSI